MMTALMLMVCVVLFNHMGLCDAVEGILHYRFKVLSCVKCGTFWTVLIASLVEGTPIIMSMALSFMTAYAALWLELLLGLLGRAYEDTYDKIQAAETDKDEADTESQVPKVQQ